MSLKKSSHNIVKSPKLFQSPMVAAIEFLLQQFPNELGRFHRGVCVEEQSTRAAGQNVFDRSSHLKSGSPDRATTDIAIAVLSRDRASTKTMRQQSQPEPPTESRSPVTEPEKPRASHARECPNDLSWRIGLFCYRFKVVVSVMSSTCGT